MDCQVCASFPFKRLRRDPTDYATDRGNIMSKIWDEREKSLEEEYFRRKERELIERLRAKRAEEEGGREAPRPAINCPKCDGVLVEITHEGVQIERCEKCNGVWLDAGELERLTSQDEHHGWLSRMWRSLTAK